MTTLMTNFVHYSLVPCALALYAIVTQLMTEMKFQSIAVYCDSSFGTDCIWVCAAGRRGYAGCASAGA